MTQQARAILPDATNATDFVLIKCCSRLRLTYEIRMAAAMAHETRRKLRVIVPNGASVHPVLTSFARQHSISIEHHRK